MSLIVPSGSNVRSASVAKASLLGLEEIDPASIQCLEYRVLLRVVDVSEMTEGGLLKPDSFFEKELYNKTMARLVRMGAECFTGSSGEKIGGCPVEGDLVVTTKYAGNVYRDGENNLYRFANDKDVVAVIKSKELCDE